MIGGELDTLNAAIDADRKRLCDALGLRADGPRYYCLQCQSDGHKHTDGDFSIEAGFRCHRCGFSTNGFNLVQLVKGCDFPAAVAFVRDLYAMAAPMPEKRATRPKAGLPTWATIEAAAAAFPRYSAKVRGGTVQKIFVCYEADRATPRGAEVRYLMPDGHKEPRPFRFDGSRWHSGAPETWTLYGLRDLPAAGPVHIPEGPKCRDAMHAAGLPAVASFQGSSGAKKTDFEPLQGRDIVLMPDADEPGEKYVAEVAAKLTAQGCRLRVLRLPGLESGGDVADYLEAGNTAASVEALANDAPEWKAEASKAAAATDDKPPVYLPDGATTITAAAAKLGALLAERLDIFNRGGAIVQLTADAEGKPQLMDVKPAALASTFETVANLRKETSKGDFPACCCEAMARLIMHAEAFRDALPRLSMLAACPVLTEHDGALVEVHGYDPQTGIYASGDKPETVELAEAVDLLSDVLEGFRFATPADGSRARAALITPALIFGKLLPGRAPIDLGEADNSQSGKGYRDKLKTAVYGQAAKTITQKSAGVGGLEESFSNALIRGCSFIQFDNVKGKIDSPAVESFLTEDHFTARAPYREPVDIDPRCVCVGMTSNKADLTKDLANRCSAVRILKQPDGHHFKSYPEGDVLDHIRANQPRYLGAVFAVVKAWHAAGKPRTHETRHDFRGWAQTLDWIVQNIFNAPPLMEGHRETQTRMTNPALGWLRDVAIEVLRANQGGTWLRAFDLLDLLSETEIEMPGTPEHGDLDEPETRKKALQAIGRKMGICFRAGEVMAIDGMTISRREGFEIEKARTVREYCFEAPPMDGTDNRGNGAAHRGKDASLIPERDESNTESTVSPIAPPMDSPMDSPIKTLVSPNSPIGSKHIKGDENMTLNNSNKSSKGAIGGIGGKRDASDVPEEAPAAPAADLFTPHETPAAKVWSVAL